MNCTAANLNFSLSCNSCLVIKELRQQGWNASICNDVRLTKHCCITIAYFHSAIFPFWWPLVLKLQLWCKQVTELSETWQIGHQNTNQVASQPIYKVIVWCVTQSGVSMVYVSIAFLVWKKGAAWVKK